MDCFHIWVRYTGAWGITPMKWVLFIRLYLISKTRMFLSENLPGHPKNYTEISDISVTFCNSDWGGNGHCGSPNSTEAARSPQRMKELHRVSIEREKNFQTKNTELVITCIKTKEVTSRPPKGSLPSKKI